jgi:hypothetical protein
MYLNNKDKTMKLINIFAISIIGLFMVACGGGGGGDSSTPSSPSVPTAPVIDVPIVPIDDQPDPDATYDSTAELIVSKSFLIEQEYELAVSYNSRSAYLSVCTDFTEGQAGIKVDYNSCLLRTAVDNDYAGTLTVANDKNRLVMAIWYLDDAKNPRYEIWENSGDTNEIKKFVVN